MLLSLRRGAITTSRRREPPDGDRALLCSLHSESFSGETPYGARVSLCRYERTAGPRGTEDKRVESKLSFLGSERLRAFLKRNQLASFQKPGTTKDRGKHLLPLYRSFTPLAAAGEQKLLVFAHEKRSVLGEVPGRPSDEPASAPHLLWLIPAGRGSPGIRDAVLLSQGQRGWEAVCHHTCP